MGKAARNKKNRKITPAAPRIKRVSVDPAPEGSFAAGGRITRIYEVNKFHIDTMTNGDEAWAELSSFGAVTSLSTSDYEAEVEALLRHPKISEFRTEGGHPMRGYIAGRKVEGSLTEEFVPALILVEFQARALINAVHAFHRQTGQLVDLQVFDQINSVVASSLRQLATPFTGLNVSEIEKTASLKARWRGVDVVRHEVAFPPAA